MLLYFVCFVSPFSPHHFAFCLVSCISQHYAPRKSAQGKFLPWSTLALHHILARGFPLSTNRTEDLTGRWYPQWLVARRPPSTKSRKKCIEGKQFDLIDIETNKLAFPRFIFAVKPLLSSVIIAIKCFFFSQNTVRCILGPAAFWLGTAYI